MLTLAGNSANNTSDWGIVENLAFASDGSGILSITASPTRSLGVSFSGIQADSVDLTYGNIALDLSGLGFIGDDWMSALFAGFSFESLFGTENIDGITSLSSFGISGVAEDTFWILNDGVFASDDWSFTEAGIVYNGDSGGGDVPEPATLAIIGLGLAGLGLARRRNRK
jgi:hypothetical protein